MELNFEDNRIYLQKENGDLLAEITFPNISDKFVNINHTFLDNSMRGQGVAGELMISAAEMLRKENKKAYLTSLLRN